MNTTLLLRSLIKKITTIVLSGNTKDEQRILTILDPVGEGLGVALSNFFFMIWEVLQNKTTF